MNRPVKVQGYKDNNGTFHNSEYLASRANLIEELKSDIYERPLCPYTVRKTLEYIVDEYNLLDRKTVPFWRTII